MVCRFGFISAKNRAALFTGTIANFAAFGMGNMSVCTPSTRLSSMALILFVPEMHRGSTKKPKCVILS
jgi:hypothetical protein